eukprot:gb/GEZJ01001466.1/.p1 GENE.gb/GEZJ01001466.1/~~gb/GEZJ01001466.1/.p1  ORF type:complete len:332 (+),score=43.85 gb/GEZJ01001466.1/:752-1747(+)
MIFTGTPSHMKELLDNISAKFDVERFNCGTDIVFNRLFIKQLPDFSIKLSMKEFLASIEQIDLAHSRQNQNDEECTADELREFQGLNGKLNFLGDGILPQASLFASKLQQHVSRLKVSHIRQINQALTNIRSLAPTLLFQAPESPLSKQASDVRVLAFSDAASGSSSYVQTGLLCGLVYRHASQTRYHTSTWQSSKQSHVSFSSAGAEILSAAHTADRAFYIAETLPYLLEENGKAPRPTLQMLVDSCGLYRTISTLHEQKDYRLRPTVSRLRHSFEAHEINSRNWIPGPKKPADVLTKVNPNAFKKLEKIISECIIPEDIPVSITAIHSS